MGMLFGGWIREEEEEFKNSGLSWEDFKSKKDYEYNNKNLTHIKRIARFKGIELQEGDIICNDINAAQYFVNDFQEDGRPICTLISLEKHEHYKKLYPFEEVLLLTTNI